MGKKEIEKIKSLLKPIAKNSLAVYLYGSFASGTAHEKSDFDICIIAEEGKKELFRESNVFMSKHPEADVKLFEELPLFIKKEIIENGILLYCKNKERLEDYLGFYKRLWNGQAAVRLKYAKAIA